jgi:hypothetical protein
VSGGVVDLADHAADQVTSAGNVQTKGGGG